MSGIGTNLLWLAFGLHASTSTLFVLGARRELSRPLLCSWPAPFVQITPAYNETTNLDTITENVIAVRNAAQPVILIDDGSTDGCSAALRCIAETHGALLITQARNSGKAAALNAGLDCVSVSTVLTLDADTTVQASVASDLSGHIGAEADAIALQLVPAPPYHGLTTLQKAEYAYIQNFERTALASFGLIVTVPGAASLWRREALIESGGFSGRTLSEDTDMTLALQARGGQVWLARDRVAVTRCPQTLRALVRQRARWTWGNLQAGLIHGWAAIRNRPIVANRRPGVAMAGLCLIKLANYGIVSISSLRLVLGGFGPVDLVAIGAIFGATVARFIVTRAILGSTIPPIASALILVAMMQAINLLAFWWGLFRGMAWWRKWQTS